MANLYTRPGQQTAWFVSDATKSLNIIIQQALLNITCWITTTTDKDVPTKTTAKTKFESLQQQTLEQCGGFTN